MAVAIVRTTMYHYEANQGDVPDFYAGTGVEHASDNIRAIIDNVRMCSVAVLRGFFDDDTKPIQQCFVRRWLVDEETGERLHSDALFEATFSDASLDECVVEMLEPVRMVLTGKVDDE